MRTTKRICTNKAFRRKTGAIYRQRKIDVETVFGFSKANFGFTRFSVHGKSKVENEIGLALMAVNIPKYAASV
ncbi:transposase [Psychrobacillus sp. FSL K6-1415]|jgi:hypothetical protein|uniref:transposase n=1 Tax=Psychrobacillus sp. FSL K6-1415 TaxID=2921544 RepID=UPI000ABF7070